VEAKRKAWAAARASADWQKAEFVANLYVAAFFAPKTRENKDRVPLTEDLHRVRANLPPRPGLAEAVAELAARHRFFHWHLAFPEVMQRGGFDVVLGNPPWERVKLQEQEFFASRSPTIARAPNKAERERLIAALNRPDADLAERALYREFESAKRGAEATSLFLHSSGRYPLTGVGDVNTYAVFAETFLDLMAPGGRAGLIVPTGIATDDSTKRFFAAISSRGRLVSLYDFENRERIFPAVDSRYKFSLLTLGSNVARAEYVFFATRVEHLRDTERRFSLGPEEIRLIN